MSIPTELVNRPQWIVWRRKGDQKVPYDPRSGRPASVADRTTWAPYSAAKATVGRYDGVGYVFSTDDDFAGVDLDDCRDPATGVVANWARTIVDDLASYAEVSPSGTGVKIIVRGRAATARRGSVEVYSGLRYFALTGRHLVGTPTTIRPAGPALAALVASLARPTGGAAPEATALADSEVLSLARRGALGVAFGRLYDDGDASGFDSPSEADAFFAGRLAYFSGGDADQIERIWDASALARKAKMDRADYASRTIEAAIAAQQTVYRPEPTLPDVDVAPIAADEAYRICVDYAASASPTEPAYMAAFTLCRKLRAISSGDPRQFKEAIRAYCNAVNRPFQDFYPGEFLKIWPKVEWAEGDGAYASALADADELPYGCQDLTDEYARFVSICYHLAQREDDQTFFLPRKRLMRLLDVKSTTISRYLQYAAEEGLIECVDDNYAYTGGGRAKTYRFVGATLAK